MPRRCPKCGSEKHLAKAVAYCVVYKCKSCGKKTRTSARIETHDRNSLVNQGPTTYQPSIPTPSVKPYVPAPEAPTLVPLAPKTYRIPIPKAVVETPSGVKTAQAHPELGWETCTVCQVSLLAKNLERHMKKTHGTEPIQKVQVKKPVTAKAKTETLTSEVACPECGKEVGKDSLVKHVRKSHGHEKARQHGLTPPKPTEVVRCRRPYCKAELKADEMAEHLRVVHGIVRVAQPVPKNTTSPKSEAPSEKKRQSNPVRQSSVIYTNVEKLEQAYFDRRDGSRGYAHPFREYGRYGSHPIHDDYGDESGPH